MTPKLLRGTFLDGQRAKIVRLHSVSPTHLRVVLRQGINRQIRRMFEALGYRVKHLSRVRVGNLRLADLPRGHWRVLMKRELEGLHLPRRSVVAAAGADRGNQKARQLTKGQGQRLWLQLT